MKIMIVVTHLLGTGHLSRAVALARGAMQAGHQVVIVSGGMPVAHLETADLHVEQLPPLKSDGVNFTRLLDQTGSPVSPEMMQLRQTQLIRCFKEMAPDVLVTELFPFGRRGLRTEFLALLDLARATSTCIAASVRDILNPPSKRAKVDWADEIISHYYDAVLVHADPNVITLDTSWPVTPLLSDRLRYTGFVAPQSAKPHPQGIGKGEVLVSAGGGPVGATLFKAASATAALDPGRMWRLFIGGSDAPQLIDDLQSAAPPNLIVGPTRPDFRQMVRHASASVSMCGYNTALDVLQSSVPAVFIPFDAGGEVEQTLRATALSTLPGIEMLHSEEVTPDGLLAAVQRATAAPQRNAMQQGLDGAARSANILSRLFEEKQCK
ncbi:MAG: glycosyltransferase family protein [Roseobacter sp.]